MTKIGVLGVGHLGKIHLKCLSETDFEIVGFYDPDAQRAALIEEEFGIRGFGDVDALIDQVDAVDIVSKTNTHAELMEKALLKGKHVFVEKPFVTNLGEARHIHNLVTDQVVQIGHVERFNPVYLKAKDYGLSPKFIEAHRLANFNPRGNDVSVVLDLMIHDLDLVLDMVDSEVSDVSASGVSVVSRTPDICNARIVFANGTVANLTSSRISLKGMRKLRLFQKDMYISMDFMNKECQVISLHDDLSSLSEEAKNNAMTIGTEEGTRRLEVNLPAIHENNAIVEELREFSQSIHHGKKVKVDLKAGIRSLEIAERINQCINEAQ